MSPEIAIGKWDVTAHVQNSLNNFPCTVTLNFVPLSLRHKDDTHGYTSTYQSEFVATLHMFCSADYAFQGNYPLTGAEKTKHITDSEQVMKFTTAETIKLFFLVNIEDHFYFESELLNNSVYASTLLHYIRFFKGNAFARDLIPASGPGEVRVRLG
jgi:hypothetical protein